GVVLACTVTALRVALASVASRAASARSIPTTGAAPSRAATIASTPVPHPTSRTDRPGPASRSVAAAASLVVGWSPRPNAPAGSILTTVRSDGTGSDHHAGQIVSVDETST